MHAAKMDVERKNDYILITGQFEDYVCYTVCVGSVKDEFGQTLEGVRVSHFFPVSMRVRYLSAPPAVCVVRSQFAFVVH